MEYGTHQTDEKFPTFYRLVWTICTTSRNTTKLGTLPYSIFLNTIWLSSININHFPK